MQGKALDGYWLARDDIPSMPNLADGKPRRYRIHVPVTSNRSLQPTDSPAHTAESLATPDH